MPRSKDQSVKSTDYGAAVWGAAALTAYTEEALQWLISCFACTCREFGLTISLKKTNIMVQDLSSIPNISISDYTLQVVEDFTYLGSTISSSLFLDAELNTQIAKEATAMAHLAKRVWENSMLTINTKMKVYQACVLSTLPYGSKAWTLLPPPPRMQTQCLPPVLPQKDFGHHLAGLCPQTRMSWLRQEHQACLSCLPKGTCAGLVMSAACRMAKSQRMCCSASLPLAPDLQEDMCIASKTSVNKIWRQATSIQQAGNL